MMTLEIVVDENIYDNISSRPNINNQDRGLIIVKSTISPRIVKCVFLYRTAANMGELLNHISGVNNQFDKEEWVSRILIHDSIVYGIAANRVSADTDISTEGRKIKDELGNAGFKRIRLCSQVGSSSRVIDSIKPIFRDEYTKHDWEQCTVEEIKKGENKNDFLEVVEDRNFKHFNEIYIHILNFLLGRFWDEKRKTNSVLVKARTEGFAKFLIELKVYSVSRGFPAQFDEETYYKAMMPLLRKQHDNATQGNYMCREDFEEKYKVISDAYNKIKWVS